jgi:hypothetical protein
MASLAEDDFNLVGVGRRGRLSRVSPRAGIPPRHFGYARGYNGKFHSAQRAIPDSLRGLHRLVFFAVGNTTSDGA